MKQEMLLLITALLGIAGISGLDIVEDSKLKLPESQSALQECVGVMKNNGLNVSGFAQDVTHGIHSITLEEIRYYFEPNATQENRIPVVNLDLSSEEPILFHAPLIGYNKAFKTMALKVMSYVMQHNKPDFGIQGVNAWEKVGHVYHMHEVYAAAVPLYKKMKENPPDVSLLCPCVNDIVGNGILIKLSKFAQGMRFYNSKQKEAQRSKRSALAKYKKWTGTIPAGDVGKYKKWSNIIPQAFQKRSANDETQRSKRSAARGRGYKKWSISVPQAFQKRSADDKDQRSKRNALAARKNKWYIRWESEIPAAFQENTNAETADAILSKKSEIKIPQAFQKRSADDESQRSTRSADRGNKKRKNKWYIGWKGEIPKAFQQNTNAETAEIKIPHGFQKRSAGDESQRSTRSAARENKMKKYKKWEIKIPAAFQKRSLDDDADKVDEAEKEYLENTNAETAEALLSVKEWVPNSLEGPDQWISYEAMLTASMPNDQELFDFVNFMFCKLNHPNLDLSEALFK